jgi:hypothetical protein
MVNRSGSTKRRLNETQYREFKTPEMGMRISRGVHPEVSQETYLRADEKGIRSDHSGFGVAVGLSFDIDADLQRNIPLMIYSL